MLTRSEFQATCKALQAKNADWAWVDRHPYGYLVRTRRYLLAPSGLAHAGFGDELEELGQAEDGATASDVHTCAAVISQQYIVFAATFQVPAFYFTVHDTSGTPLALDELMATPLFKYQVPEGSRSNGFALTVPAAPFPLLSQGDHPVLGTPCWYLHPCETERAVDELLQAAEKEDCSGDERLLRWMELWLMTVGSVIRL